MGKEIDADSMEGRKERVLQALDILIGKERPLITEDERAIIGEYRALSSFGFGRMEIIVVAHRMDGVNLTYHKKRRDLIISP